MVTAPERSEAPPARRSRNGPPAAAWRSPRLDLRFARGDLSGVREIVSIWASESVSGEPLDDMVLLVHELCGNAIKHGGGSGRLRLWRTDGRLACEVGDNGPGMDNPDAAGRRLPPSNTPGGRGLWLARQVATLDITTGPTGTTVVAKLRNHG